MNEQERIQALLEKENLSPKDFATEIGISPATMSNLLSGRNNPSLDVMQKILARFRMVNSDWLILGVGSMYRQKNQVDEPLLFDVRPEDEPTSATAEMPSQPLIQEEIPAVQTMPAQPAIQTVRSRQRANKSENNAITAAPVIKEKKIQKILVFFDDGTFQELDR